MRSPLANQRTSLTTFIKSQMVLLSYNNASRGRGHKARGLHPSIHPTNPGPSQVTSTSTQKKKVTSTTASVSFSLCKIMQYDDGGNKYRQLAWRPKVSVVAGWQHSVRRVYFFSRHPSRSYNQIIKLRIIYAARFENATYSRIQSWFLH